MVGAVVVRDDRIVGEGWHDGPGAPHAEVVALDDAGDRARGAAIVCTMEPCDHHGRTPPCTEALLDAGIATVVYASPDPNPLVDGRGARDACARPGSQVEHGLMRGRSRPAERRVPAPRAHRPTVRAMEDRDVPRRQGGGTRRVVALDHRGGRPPRRAPAPSVGGRDRGRGRHGARRRPGADGADSNARVRGLRSRVARRRRRDGCRRPAPLFDARRRDPRRHDGAVVRRPARGVASRRSRGAGVRRGEARAGSTSRTCSTCSASVTSRECLLEGGPTLAWASFARGSWTRSSRTSRRSWSAAPARRGRSEAKGSRRSPTALELRFDAVERDRRRPSSGGRCSPGSLRSSGPCARWTRPTGPLPAASWPTMRRSAIRSRSTVSA